MGGRGRRRSRRQCLDGGSTKFCTHHTALSPSSHCDVTGGDIYIHTHTQPYFPRQLQPKIWLVYCAVDAHNDRFCWPLLAYHLLAVLTNALTTILPHLLDKKHLWHLQTFFPKLYLYDVARCRGNFGEVPMLFFRLLQGSREFALRRISWDRASQTYA